MTVRENVQVALVPSAGSCSICGPRHRFAREEAGRLLELVGMNGYAERPCGNWPMAT